ncbi:MAG: cupin domain-containing protein [Pseudomonadota bacterium]
MTTRKVGIFAAAFLLVGGVGAGADELPDRGDGVPRMVQPEDLVWGPVASLPPGAEITVLEGDPESAEPFTIRLRMPTGYLVPPHLQPGSARVTVLRGTFHFAHGDTFDRAETVALPVGGFAIMPPEEPMFGYTEGETVIQLHGRGPWAIEYLNPEDDPRI